MNGQQILISLTFSDDDIGTLYVQFVLLCCISSENKARRLDVTDKREMGDKIKWNWLGTIGQFCALPTTS